MSKLFKRILSLFTVSIFVIGFATPTLADTAEEPGTISGNYNLYIGNEDPPKSIGNVKVSNDDTNIYVQYNTTGDWYMTDNQVGVFTAPPSDRPSPGQTKYKREDGLKLQTCTITIPLQDLKDKFPGVTEFYLTAHTSVIATINGESNSGTAYGGGTKVKEKTGAWFWYIKYMPTINTDFQIVKTADKTTAKVGDTVTYNIAVTNTGNVDLANVNVIDTMLKIEQNIPLLAKSQTVNISKEYLITEDIPIGNLRNIAVATYQSLVKSGDVSITIYTEQPPVEPTNNPDFQIVKTADKTTAKVGDTVTYNIAVTNTGNVDLANVNVIDTLLKIDQNIPLLAKSQTVNISKEYLITEDIPTGNLKNIAVATYQSLVKSDDVSIVILEDITDDPTPEDPTDIPSIKIVKTADKITAKPGDTIKYTIAVTNDGNVDLTNVNVKDKMIEINETIAELKVGKTIYYKNIPYVIPADYADDTLTNIAEVISDETELKQAEATVKIITDIPDEDNPEGPIDIPDDPNPEGPVDIQDEDTPYGPVLPQTGGISPDMFYMVGGLIILAGLSMFKKRR